MGEWVKLLSDSGKSPRGTSESRLQSWILENAESGCLAAGQAARASTCLGKIFSTTGVPAPG
eukprot:333033-Hanusia_phi.AAC.1